MALEAQASASPSPHRSLPHPPDAAADPPALSSAHGATGDDGWPDPENPLAGATTPGSPPADPSTVVVVVESRHHAAAANYSEAVNVIGFVYSMLQFHALVGLMRKDKHLISHPKRDLFDFAMDQNLQCPND